MWDENHTTTRRLSRIRKVGFSRLRFTRRCHPYVVRKVSSLKQLSPIAEYGGNDTLLTKRETRVVDLFR